MTILLWLWSQDNQISAVLNLFHNVYLDHSQQRQFIKQTEALILKLKAHLPVNKSLGQRIPKITESSRKEKGYDQNNFLLD